MIKKKQRRLVSWLMVLMIVLHVFSPFQHVWAEGLDAKEDRVIEISNHDNVASGSQANKPEPSAEEETGVPEDHSGFEEGQTEEPAAATDSNASNPSGSVSLLPVPELLEAAALAGAKDVTGLLKDLNISVTQNGLPVTEITAGQNFTVDGSFKVPVEGDGISDPDQYVSFGDFAVLQLDQSVTVIGSVDFDLMFDGDKVGTLSFTAGSTEVTIVFDGEVLNEPGITNVNCDFGITMKYTGTDVTEENPRDNVWILGKQFTVKAAEVPITQTQTKSGKLSDDKTQIEWTVTVNAKKSGDISLLGYEFQDNLTNIGEYVEDTFKVNGIEPSPKVIPDADNVLSYVFGDVKGEQVVTFRTKIPADTLITGGIIKNTAKFGKDTLIHTNTAQISIQKKTLIEKSGVAGDGLSGGTYDPSNRTITWTITVNQDQIPLQDLTITDQLPTSPAGLSWKSAKWEYESAADTWDELTAGGGLTDVPSYGAEPLGGAYKLTGTTSKKVRLTIVCDVANDAFVGTVKNYHNTASLTWTGKPGGNFTDSADVGIGIDGLTKGYVETDYASRQIQWTATVDLKNQTGFTSKNDIRVYDLLIYGQSGTFDKSASNLESLLPVNFDLTNLIPKYGQKVIDNSWPAGLTYHTEPVTVNGGRVGDLLVVEGFDTDKAYTFTFKTQVLDPNIYAANADRTIDNTASLYYGAIYLDSGNAATTYKSSVLSKQVYQSGTSAVGNSGNAFNPLDKTAVFRLNINGDGHDLTGAATANGTLGRVTVTDTLPDGWSFVDFDPGVTYQIYTSIGNNPVADPSDILESAAISGTNASFVFKKLEKAYYILVKAKLSDEKYMEYLKTSYANGKSDSYQTATNNVTLTAEGDTGWNPTKTATVFIPTQFLVKNINTGKNPLEWTIKFNPYDLPGFSNIKITDTIPEGLELPFERNGSLDLTAFTITEFDHMVNGTFPASGGTVLTLQQLQERLSYDKASRELSFTLTDGKLYQIVYTTEVTGNVGNNLKNQVKVTGSSIDGTGTNASYQVDSSHASATLERNGYLDIRKVNAQNQIIHGAVFTLYTDKELQDPVRTSTVRPDGTLRILPIPAPKAYGDPAFTYYLKETKVPDTYESDDMVYVVTVEKNAGNKVVTAVAGKSAGAVLTVVNYQPDTVGNLTIRKTVDGNGGDTGKDFNFTIQLTGTNVDGTYNYIGSGNKENGQLTITGGLGTIQLKHKESITITGLPKDTSYLVTEDSYSADGYQSEGSGTSGTIKADQVHMAEFTNTKFLPGRLTIKKTVAGNSGETGPFDFTVSFQKPDGAADNNFYSFTGTGGIPNGTIQSGGTVSLSGGQSVTITGLPKDTSYSVTENDYSANGYSTASTGSSGIVRTDEEQTASFVNTKTMPGSLTISKTVAGTSTTKKFDFKVIFTKPDKTVDTAPYKFTGRGEFPTDEIRSGDTISLADGENITITGLPDGTGYQVTEADYSSERYTTAKTGDIGTIDTLKTSVAAFTNTYRRSSSGGGGGGGGEPKPQQPAPTTPAGPGVPTPAPSLTPAPSPTLKPREEMTPQELYDVYGEVPLGYLIGVDGQLIPLGLPKTGDDRAGGIVIYGLLCISVLLGMAACESLLRKKFTGN